MCRLALAAGEIDAASFTAIRLVSGAVVMAALAFRALRTWPGSVRAALALFLYAAPFSYAYLELGAGIGALVLFGSVQVTMIGWGVARGGERSPLAVWLGLLFAFGGLVGLTVPGKSAPPLIGALSMAFAGAMWGAYSLLGRGSASPPLVTTAANFVRTVPMIAVVLAVASLRGSVHVSVRGALLAVASGALASGVGYSLWYAALRDLTATRAAILQLVVPILAAGAGVALLGESITLRLAIASVATLGGVALAIVGRGK